MPLFYVKNLIQCLGIGLSLNIVLFLLNGLIWEVSQRSVCQQTSVSSLLMHIPSAVMF